MTKQDELDAILRKLATGYEKLNDKQIDYGIKEVGRVRNDVADLLAEFAEGDGIIKRQRLSRLLRELDAIEKSLREYGTVAMTEIVRQSSEYVTKGTTDAVTSLTGYKPTRADIEKINERTVDYVIRRFGDDGLVLSDRIWTTSGDIRDSIATTLRGAIIRGDDVGSMIRDVRKVYDAETWKIKRLVVTEGNTAYRVGSANSVRDSEVADWVQLKENGFRHGNHRDHKCYKLAQENRYGEGRGVFKPSDSEIYLPHPNCSSYIIPVINPEFL